MSKTHGDCLMANYLRGPARNNYKGGAGTKKPKLYVVWRNMRGRCNCKSRPDYKYYGGRGIKVCSRWNDYYTFAADVGPHPGKGWTLDRINNNSNYRPDNVRWATRRTQSQNRNYCVLNPQLVVKIRTFQAQKKIGYRKIAAKFGLAESTVYFALFGNTWR